MSEKNKKQFGVWMDSQNATIVGRENIDSGEFVVLNQIKNGSQGGNSNENAANNSEVSSTLKFFKEIVSNIQNMDEMHATGTGQIQEQFIKFLADTPQYKNVLSTISTANKMSDESLVEYVEKHFN
ncbi:MAG: hypothetical protein ABIP68_03250 [Ferruginibacter sp.]